MKQSLITFGTVWLLSGPVQAQDVLKACVSSDRGNGQRALCSCIQTAADQTLTKRDKRLVIEFFANPQRAQEIRRSTRRANERFWERYERFGTTAEALCER